MVEAALGRQQRKEETRRALIDAAAQLFAERGVEASSLDDIARRVGLTKGAIYANFPNKQALVEAVAEANSALLDLDMVTGGLAKNIADVILGVDAQKVMLDVEWLLQCIRSGQFAALLDLPPEMVALREQAFGPLAEPLGVPAGELAAVVQAVGRGIAQELARTPGCISEATIVTLLSRWFEPTNQPG